MASLKSFLFEVAPVLGVNGATLYERQRALVDLGVLIAIEGRGRGSGVPLTGDNFAAILISMLATDSLSEVDENVVALCDATAPERFRERHKRTPTFKTELGRVLSGQPPEHAPEATVVRAVRVSRAWMGQIVLEEQDMTTKTVILAFVSRGRDRERGAATRYPSRGLSRGGEPRRGFSEPIRLTAEIEIGVLQKLVEITCSALKTEEEDEE
jgi:hypothetical protein